MFGFTIVRKDELRRLRETARKEEYRFTLYEEKCEQLSQAFREISAITEGHERACYDRSALKEVIRAKDRTVDNLSGRLQLAKLTVERLRRKWFAAIRAADRLRNATYFREPVPFVVLGPDDFRPEPTRSPALFDCDLGSLEVVVSA